MGHLDTVFPPGTFEGYRVDGALRRGPGVLDMKGGLLVVAWALKALSAHRLLEQLPPLRLVVVSDEEVGSPESQPMIRREAAGAQAALVFESGRARDAIITRRKGVGALVAKAHGKAAHAGNHHRDGANAIWALSRFIDRAQRLTDYPRGVTVNVGKVAGGQGKNTVPEAAEAHLDLRFCTQADAERLLRALHEAATLAESDVPGHAAGAGGGHQPPAVGAERGECALAGLVRRVCARLRTRLLGGRPDRRRERREHHQQRGHPLHRRAGATRRWISHP